MPNHGSMYQAKNANPDYFRHIPRGIELEFDDAYKKFFEKRGIDVSKDNKIIMAKEWKLSDPVFVDTQRLKKAIEYGRSYRKDKDNAAETS